MEKKHYCIDFSVDIYKPNLPFIKTKHILEDLLVVYCMKQNIEFIDISSMTSINKTYEILLEKCKDTHKVINRIPILTEVTNNKGVNIMISIPDCFRNVTIYNKENFNTSIVNKLYFNIVNNLQLIANYVIDKKNVLHIDNINEMLMMYIDYIISKFERGSLFKKGKIAPCNYNENDISSMEYVLASLMCPAIFIKRLGTKDYTSYGLLLKMQLMYIITTYNYIFKNNFYEDMIKY